MSLFTLTSNWVVGLAGSSYFRAIAMLSGGQVLATLLPFMAAPILGRLYLPTDYGALATYMALASLFGAISTLQLPMGVIAERSERSATELVAASIVLASGFAIIAGLIALVLHVGMAGTASYDDVRAWMLMLPATVLVGGITAGIAALANRRSAYTALTRIPILAALGTVGSSIILGLLDWGSDGLFLSYFLGQAIALAGHLSLIPTLGMASVSWHPRRLLAVGWRHRDFARYTMPSQLLSIVSLDMPVYALVATGNVGLLGTFHRARALASIPLTMIGAAVTQVFRQRASEQYRRTGSCRQIYVQTALGLLSVGLPPLTLLLFFGPEIFRLVLGPNWSDAGEVARILAPMLLLRLVSSPLSTVFFFTGNQLRDLQLTVFGTLLAAAFVAGATLAFDAPYASIAGFALAYCLFYTVSTAYSWHLTEA